MPRRRSNRAVATPAKHKRQLSTGPTPQSNASKSATRSSKRLKIGSESSPVANHTPKKSKYFEHSQEEDEDESSSAADKDSGYEDWEASEEEKSSSELEDEYDSEEEKKTSRRHRKSMDNTSPAQVVSGKKDLWREGVKTGLGPGKAVFIEKPKARGDGGIKYVPERIHPHTLEFLKDLKRNNDRVWFKAHDADYRASWKDFESFIETMTEKISEVDETIPELPPKDLVFRIYRDVRFSSDPTPYKPHFSAAWSRTGRKGPYACYYLHIQPSENCFVGSGLWHPDAEPLRLLRTDFDSRPERIRSVLLDSRIRKHIFGGIGKDEKKAIQAFCKRNADNALKTKPKGYDADNPNIDLLRLRNFTIGRKISDKDILSPQGVDKITELIRAMQPFVTYLNSVVMPDEDPEVDGGGDASSSAGEADGE